MRLFLAFTVSVLAEDTHTSSAGRAAMIADFETQLATADSALADSPDSVALYSRRGDCHLFLGHFKKAVADFEKMIALDPAQDDPHWRLGIAYYFAGDFGKSARQFEKYHAYDGHDRENGLWKFLADARALGVEKARSQMLEYTAFDREPFPALYEMFAGRKTSDELFAEIEAKRLGDEPGVQFFAHYYAGLNDDLLGHREAAVAHLRKALALFDDANSPGFPGYMWQVARLHAEAR